ncbi:transcriptional regulator [Sphaerochaeta pleomorpha str. Grapes]|uniref:Transcriptional regulator n=1 Tax=Sphaerochaeta pleomorpha (strain ATCC BAA-1885 / DSM 22778 / Grapes) TaxID=158190 RepID=G8QXG9_SPHPG|nr:GntR family transcriptional regulator [Sphaerochaeta pleomorpha]AEV29532.1 transcriptional regulator [Sphaerochaeta pleomorpha str. Grapes]
MAETKNKYGGDPLKNQYHKIILDRIIHCTYKSNDIINIQSLVSEFNVSKTPIREALLELCDEGLLKSIPKFGYEVTPFEEDQIRQVLNFRYLIETSAMDAYWEMLSNKETIEELTAIVDISESLREEASPLERWEHTAQFHIKLASLYKNEYLSAQLKKAIRFLGIDYARSIWISLNPIDKYFGEECHRVIIKEIENNNKKNALLALKKDMENYRKICLNKR